MTNSSIKILLLLKIMGKDQIRILKWLIRNNKELFKALKNSHIWILSQTRDYNNVYLIYKKE
jgi:hypothetical protein